MSAVLESSLMFDEATHTYTHDGVVIPSVTQILKPLSDFSRVPAGVLKAASGFGTAVHLATELWDRQTLDLEALDPALAPYLSAWSNFCRDFDVDWHAIEERVYNRTHGYAGTLDRYGRVAGKLAVVDIKSSAELYPSVGPQLAAYKNALPSAPPTTDRIAVQLLGNGNYKTKYYTDRDDWPTFLSLLTVRKWAARHNLNPFKE